MSGLKILGTGSYVPPFTVSNADFAKIVETSDEWISSRTGIKNRHFAVQEDHRQMAGKAAAQAILNAGIDKAEIGVVAAAVITGDYHTPSLACLLQKDLELSNEILAFDLNGACSGYVYALQLAYSLLHQSSKRYALVVGSEILSRITNFADRSTCVLFGDGSGAAVVSLAEDRPFHFMSGAKGDDSTLYCRAVYPTENPFLPEQPTRHEPCIHMDGNEVFRFAVESFCNCATELLAKNNLAADDIDHYLCHQANLRIITKAARKLGVSMDKFFVNITDRGNTSAASIAIALDELNASGKLKRGDKLMICGFGGGLTYGAAYLIW